MTATPPASETADREIVATRTYDAPRDLVWRVWTDPKHIGQWWGPVGFSVTTYKMDVRPGGVWRFVMHGPDGTDYENKITFLDVSPGERLVYKHGGDKEVEPVQFQVAVTFTAEGAGKTRIDWRMLFPSKNAKDYVVEKYGAVEGLKQTMARLTEKLADMAAGRTDPDAVAGPRELMMSRVYDAPRSLVYEAWTRPEHLKEWWGPHGVTVPVCEVDLRPGGAFNTAVRTPDGITHPCPGKYRGVVENERLVFDAAPLGPDGKPWIEILTTVTFEDAGPGKTRVTARVHHKTVEARDEHEKMGFGDGWGQSWDRLGTLLAKLRG